MASRESPRYSQHVPRHVIGVHLAAYFGLNEVMIALLKNWYNLDSQDTYGETPFSYEVVMKLLLERGAELEIKDKHGRMPLFWAAEKGHEAVVKLLLEKGAELGYGWVWSNAAIAGYKEWAQGDGEAAAGERRAKDVDPQKAKKARRPDAMRAERSVFDLEILYLLTLKNLSSGMTLIRQIS